MSSGIVSPRHLHFTDLLALLPWIPAGPICDIGCGNGRLAAALAAYGLPVTALDVERELIAHNRQRYGEDIDWVQSDIRNYRMQRESYAAIFCLNVFPFIPNGERARLIGRLKAAVRPGGLMVMTGLSERDPAASTRLARSANRVSILPTGVFASGELPSRFQDWELLFEYEGPAVLSCVKENAPHEIVELVARKPQPAKAPQLSALPALGVGLSWAPGSRLVGADFLELPADGFLELEDDSALARLSRQLPLIPIAQTLSLGTPGLRADGYLEALARLLARCDSPWWSASLAFSRAEGWEHAGHQPLPATEEALETVKQNIRALRRLISTPLLLDLPMLNRMFRHDDMEPATFLRHVAEEADCGIVLDLSQLASSPDALSRLERLPRERILQLRLNADQLRTQGPALQLAQNLIQRSPVRALSITPDTGADLPELLRQARKLLRRHP